MYIYMQFLGVNWEIGKLPQRINLILKITITILCIVKPDIHNDSLSYELIKSFELIKSLRIIYSRSSEWDRGQGDREGVLVP